MERSLTMTDNIPEQASTLLPFRNSHRVQHTLCAMLLAALTMSCSTSPAPSVADSVTYTCGDASEIQIARSANRVTLTIGGESSALPQVEAASGAKYSDGTLTWWEKGDTGLVMQGDSVSLRDCRRAS